MRRLLIVLSSLIFLSCGEDRQVTYRYPTINCNYTEVSTYSPGVDVDDSWWEVTNVAVSKNVTVSTCPNMPVGAKAQTARSVANFWGDVTFIDEYGQSFQWAIGLSRSSTISGLGCTTQFSINLTKNSSLDQLILTISIDVNGTCPPPPFLHPGYGN